MTGVPLELLVAQVGEDLLEILVTPGPTELTRTAVHDPLDAGPPPPGSLVLLVGLDPAAPEAAAAVRGLRGAAAVVAGPCADEACGPLAEAARDAGLALLRMRWPLAWTHLFTLAEDVTTAPDREQAAGDVGGVPPGDLQALAGAVAVALGRPVVFVDAQWRLLAYSALDHRSADHLQRETVLNRAVPEAEALPEARRALLRDTRARRFGSGGSSRVGVGIRVGSEPCGMLWVLEGATPLPDDRLELVEEFARLAGAHVGQARAARSRYGELAEIALEGGDGAEAACRELGLDPGAGLAVVAVGAREELLGGVLLESLTAYLEAYRRPAACVLRGDTVYFPLGARAREIADDAVRRIRGRHRLIAGVGGRVRDVAGLPGSARQAGLVLEVLREREDGPAVASVAEVRTQVAVTELRHLLGDHPELLVHRAPGEDWVLAWLEAGGDYRAAADRLGLHPNTLRYRVRKLAEAGTDLRDPDIRLAAWLRLRLGMPYKR
ncbi:PucR family transcriptional regulator [Nonomuraea sediminis]|uniref:PucR family transcriptional regulator n=1 Tax=Nonomuraea sediminis TaxID=2835864 RepID=UPI001BDCE60F|nr:PucR family transcriptional regulator [Nonomuraea sediminis]